MAKKVKSKDIEAGKVCALLSYLLVGIIWYFVDEKMKKNSFVKFHVKQGLVLIIFSIIVSIVGSIFWFIPFLGWVIMDILNLAILVLAIVGIVNSLNGEKKELPVIGGFASNFKF